MLVLSLSKQAFAIVSISFALTKKVPFLDRLTVRGLPAQIIQIAMLKLKQMINEGVIPMKESVYKSYDELPLMLNAEMVKNVLGISISSAYELMHEKDFPSIKIGNRIVVPKDK